jgi:hypothetical protein
MSHKVSTELLAEARRLEADTGGRHYIIWNVPENRFEVIDKMPYLGEWYSSDGIRHG